MTEHDLLRSDQQKRRSKTEYLIIVVIVIVLFAGGLIWRAANHIKPVREDDTARPASTVPVGPPSTAVITRTQARPTTGASR